MFFILMFSNETSCFVLQISLLIAFSSLAHFTEESENNGAFKFFLFVTITAWLIVMALFGLFVLQAHERLSINWMLTVLISITLQTCANW